MSSTRRIKMFGLLLLALVGSMAVTAASASAAGEFRLIGVTFAGQGIFEKQFLGEVPLGELLVGTGGGGLNLTIHCEPGFATGNALKGGGFKAHVVFEECEVLKNSNCIIYPEEEEEGAAGTILVSAAGTLVLHGTAPNNIFGTIQSANLTIIYFGGPKCTLPEENLIAGGIVLSFPTALTELVEQEICITKGKEVLFGISSLSFGSEPAVIDPSGCGLLHLEARDKWGAE